MDAIGNNPKLFNAPKGTRCNVKTDTHLYLFEHGGDEENHRIIQKVPINNRNKKRIQKLEENSYGN